MRGRGCGFLLGRVVGPVCLLLRAAQGGAASGEKQKHRIFDWVHPARRLVDAAGLTPRHGEFSV